MKLKIKALFVKLYNDEDYAIDFISTPTCRSRMQRLWIMCDSDALIYIRFLNAVRYQSAHHDYYDKVSFGIYPSCAKCRKPMPRISHNNWKFYTKPNYVVNGVWNKRRNQFITLSMCNYCKFGYDDDHFIKYRCNCMICNRIVCHTKRLFVVSQDGDYIFRNHRKCWMSNTTNTTWSKPRCGICRNKIYKPKQLFLKDDNNYHKKCWSVVVYQNESSNDNTIDRSGICIGGMGNIET